MRWRRCTRTSSSSGTARAASPPRTRRISSSTRGSFAGAQAPSTTVMPGVGEAVDAGVERVGEAAPLDDLEGQARGEAVVEDPADAEVDRVVRRGARAGRGTRARTPPARPRARRPPAAARRGQGGGARSVDAAPARQRPEVLLGERADERRAAPGRPPRGRGSRRCRSGRGGRGRPPRARRRTRGGRPRNLEGERVPGEGDPLREVVRVDVAAVRVHLVEDLLQDHLALDRHLAQERPPDEVAEDGEAGPELARVDGGEVAAVVAGGDAVQAPARALDRGVHRDGVGPALRAAEEEVLEEVRDAVHAGGLVARARRGRRARSSPSGARAPARSRPAARSAARRARPRPTPGAAPDRRRRRRPPLRPPPIDPGPPHGAAAASARSSSAGRRSVNVVPRPTALSQRIVPPCSFTTCSVNARPSPVPRSFVE